MPDAIMYLEIVGYGGGRTRCEVLGRGDRYEPAIVEDADDFHVALDPVPGSDAGIEAIAYDVTVGVVDRQFELDVRVVGEERSDQGPKPSHGEHTGYGQSQCPDGLVAKRVDALDGVIDAFENRLNLRQQPLAGLRERHAARGAIEQPDTQLLFEALDRLADGGQGAPDMSGSLGEAQGIRDRRECREL